MIEKYNFDRPLLCFSISQTYDYEQLDHNPKPAIHTAHTDQRDFFKPLDMSRYLGIECDFGFAKGESNVFTEYLFPERPNRLSLYSRWIKAFRLTASFIEKNDIKEPYAYFEFLFQEVRNLFDKYGVTKERLLKLRDMYPHHLFWEFNLYFVENTNPYGHLSLKNLSFIVELGAELNIYQAGETEKLILSKFV